MVKRVLILFLCVLLVFSALSGCAQKPEQTVLPDEGNTNLKALVLYDGSAKESGWEDTYYYLSQSLLLQFEVASADVSKGISLEGYDVVYPDASIIQSENAGDIREALVRFAENGGGVFLENAFYRFFDADFIGAKEFVKVEEYPAALNFPSAGDDLGEIQQVLEDFAGLYQNYSDFEALSRYDYGYGVKLGSAKALVTYENIALYTMNEYGKGYVFFTNPLLPNHFSASGFTMLAQSGGEEPFASTTASGNQLLYHAFASFLSKQQYGYSLSRVFGSFGRPSMAWELHFEEITGFENNASVIFAELCKEYLQVPSYSLVRSSYWWFLRAESVSYLLNEAENGALSYTTDLEESAYSSGTHVASGNEWLSLSEIKEGNSYFEDYPEFTMRAYPFAADISGDGVLDLLCGSEDGKFYFYIGKPYENRFQVSEAQTLKDEAGKDLSVSGYSAPVMLDMNGDGVLDLLSGDENGNIYLFAGTGRQVFEKGEKLLSTPLSGQAMPAVGDINGDGVLDLLVGSNEGRLFAYYGTKEANGAVTFSENTMEELSSACGQLGTWLAPHAVDFNGDGRLDIAVGTFDGYVAKLANNGEGFVLDSYFTSDEPNYKGNNNIKFGNNCVPFFTDINGDGALDLLCGSLEYGMCYPIDSDYFPCREELQEQVEYLQENGFYIGAHFYTNEYSSKEREAYELERHLEALESYGIDTSFIGANQHTWHTNKEDKTQTMLSLYNAGLLWQSGFKAPGSNATPQVSPENVLSLPFFLIAEGEETLLIQNNSTLLYNDKSKTDISARYDMPMCMYYHCDFVYDNQDGARASIQVAEDFRNDHAYNMVMENQMMRQIAAAYNLEVTLAAGERAEEGKLDLVVTPSAVSENSAFYEEGYQNSCGVKISFSQKYDADKMAVDADVWYREGNAIYFAANRAVEIYETNGWRDGAHLEQINIAAEVETHENGAQITFLDGGMMQIAVSGKAGTDSAGWTVTEKDGKTMFTKYGNADTINITF